MLCVGFQFQGSQARVSLLTSYDTNSLRLDQFERNLAQTVKFTCGCLF